MADDLRQGDARGIRTELDLGVDKMEELNETGVRSTSGVGREEESLVRVLTGMRSRVALMLAKQISHLQLASFRQPG